MTSILAVTYSCISVKADVNRNDVIIKDISDYNTAKAEILNVMKAQEIAWNNGDLEGFMQGYWKNDSLKFYGHNGLTKGWQNTLDNYKKRYPSKKETGVLNFIVNDISPIEDRSYWVMGEYHLKRDVGNTDGIFIVIFKRVNGEWKIVADMSC